MSTINFRFGRMLAGSGGVLLIASLFLAWTDDPGGVARSGWEFLSLSDVFFLIAGLLGIAVAITGGRFGFFRPDLSLIGTADIFGVVAAVLIGWLIAFDFPSGASPEPGVYLALVAAVAIATGAGDFRVTTLFPRMPNSDRPSQP